MLWLTVGWWVRNAQYWRYPLWLTNSSADRAMHTLHCIDTAAEIFVAWNFAPYRSVLIFLCRSVLVMATTSRYRSDTIIVQFTCSIQCNCTHRCNLHVKRIKFVYTVFAALCHANLGTWSSRCCDGDDVTLVLIVVYVLFICYYNEEKEENDIRERTNDSVGSDEILGGGWYQQKMNDGYH